MTTELKLLVLLSLLCLTSPAQECKPQAKLLSTGPFERGSLIAITLECPPAGDDPKTYALWVNDWKIGRYHSAGAQQGSLVFQLADSSPDAAESKTLAADWLAISGIAQPVNVALKLGKDQPSAIPVTGDAKLYASPAILAVRCPIESCVVSKGDVLSLTIANESILRAGINDEPLFLYLDRQPMGIPYSLPQGNSLQFRLTTDGTTEQVEKLLPAWRALMAKDGYDKVKLPVAIGTASKLLVSSATGEVSVERVPGWQLLSATIGVLGLIIVTIVLGIKSELLRENCPPPVDGRRRAYSLTRCQITWWFLIVVSATCFYWVVLNEELAIPTNMLALLGVSAVTGAVAYTVDITKDAHPQPIPSDGFIKDLLTSANGVEIHRYQMIVWTVVFGIMIIREFATTLVLPNPSATWLGLLGLSGGLYVGFKIPEKKV